MIQAELLELVAKDEKDKESKKAKKKGKKKGKGEGKGEQLLCGCGAVCDAACSASSQRAGRRSSSSSPTRGASPVRAPPTPPPDAPPLPSDGTTVGAAGDGKDAPVRSKPSPGKSCPRSPARSTLGAELMSPRRPPAKAVAQQPSPMAADAAAGWETIPAGGKGRRGGVAGPRKAVPVPEQRGSSPEAPRRQSLGARPVAQPAAAGGGSRQQAVPVRAIPVTASPHTHTAAPRASPAAPVPEQRGAAEAPAVRALPVTAPKAAPVKLAAVLTSGDPIIAQHSVGLSCPCVEHSALMILQ